MIYHCCINRKVHLTPERKNHILFFHPDFKPHFSKIKEVLLLPDVIRQTREDENVLIFYKFYPDILGGKHIAVVIKINHRNFILTAYLTRKIKTGVDYEK